MPRDTPPIAQPALNFSNADSGALRYGGYPRLPADIEWPIHRDGTPFHFLAEIDLTALPREMEQVNRHYNMPEFPAKGYLYIFIRLDSDMIYEADSAVVVHAPDASADTPFRIAPKPLRSLDPDNAFAFHPKAVAEDGVSLNTGYMSASSFLSSRAENPLWRNMDRHSVTEDEIYERDRAYADQLNALGIKYEVPLPTPQAARESLFYEIPQYYQGFFKRGVFQWEWRYIFEMSKMAYALCHDFPIEELEKQIDRGNSHPRLPKVITKFKAKKEKILCSKFEDRPSWWEGFSCGHIPSLDMRIDVQLRRWMGYARVEQGRGLLDEDKEAFVALLKLVYSLKNDNRPADLKVMWAFSNHSALRTLLDLTLVAAFDHTASELQHLHPERSAKPKIDFGEADIAARHVQMFGAGYLLQNAAVEHEDKVMLFQISNACGIKIVDGIIQMWIAKNDLSDARFDKMITTLEYT